MPSRRQEEPSGYGPDQELKDGDGADADQLAQHQLKRPQGGDQHLHDARRLLLKHRAHHVDAVDEDRGVQDDRHEVSEGEGLRRALLGRPATGDLLSGQRDGKPCFGDDDGVHPFALQARGEHELGEVAFDRLIGREGGNVGGRILRASGVHQRVGQDEKPVQALRLDLGGQRVDHAGPAGRYADRVEDALRVRRDGPVEGQGHALADALGRAIHDGDVLDPPAPHHQGGQENDRSEEERSQQRHHPEPFLAHPLDELAPDHGQHLTHGPPPRPVAPSPPPPPGPPGR